MAQIDLLGGPINCIALHPETGILVAAGCHGKITFYNLDTMKPLQKCRCQTRSTVACVGFYVSRAEPPMLIGWMSCLDVDRLDVLPG
jgi:hypothetical protein